VEEDCFQVDPSAYRYARLKSRQLAGKYGFLHADAVDIEHELLLDCLNRSRAHDGTRCSPHTFFRLVIDHRISTLIESQKAACRDYRLSRLSLDAPLSTGGGSPYVRSDLKTGDCYPGPRSAASTSPETLWQLRTDLDRLLAQMPAKLSCICRLIIDGVGAGDIVARTGVSRATLYRRLGQIRSLFERAGLRRYLS
jgi:hypothetical protein